MTGPQHGRRGFALLVLTVVGLGSADHGLASAADREPRDVTVQAGLAGDPKTAETYLNANAKYVRETFPETVRACAAKSPDDTVLSFDLTITVGRGGKVTAATSEPSNAFSTCVSKAASEAVFTEPPQVPSDVYLVVSITR